ncbi:type I-F CRISPR-associated endoribonuclease Cas6/Csy4 [Azohydromonas australica]|uniref:type I-F CRISPR-associated endoribonuclease Cas6/Csy4 n=1 Tax=Azohydromonas australica TaxID=364039 RepID=UPI00041749FA|nr:type I-F CRISPR-associated endoribonuclease Cas6/Csy4 [Azohydromonas australica]
MLELCALHYVELDFTDSIEPPSHLVPLAWRWLHGFNKAQGSMLERVGIDVPGWRCGERMPGTPARLRLFGSHTALDAFVSNSALPRLRAMAVDMGPVTLAPATPSHAAVRRDNAADKNKPSRIRRSLRLGNAAPPPRQHEADLVIACDSHSTGQCFELKLRKIPAGATALAFNSFGLTLEGGLPQF